MKSMISVLAFGTALSLLAQGPGGGCGKGQGGKAGQGVCGVEWQTAGGEAVELTMPKEAWLRLWTDELAARDLYAALDAQTTRPVFRNIGRSETHHRDTIAGLLHAAGHEMPAEPKPGTYGDPEIQKVYTDLLAQGSRGELEAFQAGAAFEELDISELEREMAREGLSEAERQVLTALRDASVRHLTAFRRQIIRLGQTPKPTHLTAERIEDLLAMNDGGRKGCGQGHGRGGK